MDAFARSVRFEKKPGLINEAEDIGMNRWAVAAGKS